MTCGLKDGEVHLYSPLKAIRRRCLDCCGSSKEVSLCSIRTCSLHPYRFGKRPGTLRRQMTPGRLEALKKANEARKKRQDSLSTSQGYEEKLENPQNEG